MSAINHMAEDGNGDAGVVKEAGRLDTVIIPRELLTAERKYFQDWNYLRMVVKYHLLGTEEEEDEYDSWISECYTKLKSIVLPAALQELYRKHLDEAITAAVDNRRGPHRGDVRAAMAGFLGDATRRYEMTEAEVLDKLGQEWSRAVQKMTEAEILF